MPFTTKTAIYGGRKEGSGRPKKEITDAKKRAADAFRRILEKSSVEIANHYVKRTKKSDQVLCHAVDKLLPKEQEQPSGSATYIQFVFGSEQPRNSDAGLSEKELNGNLNGRAIRLIGDES
jgi:ribosomal protein L13